MMETRAVMDEREVAAKRFVKARFGDRTRDLVPLAAGEWSRAYALTLDGHEVVIRFGAYVDDFEKDRVMGRHSSAALPIPKVLEVGEAGSEFYAVSERVAGKPLDDLDEGEMRALLPGLLAALDELRELRPIGRHGFGLWRPDGTAPSETWSAALLAVAERTGRTAGWRERLDASPQDAEVFDAAFGKLGRLAPQLPDVRSIVHGDLLNRNVLVDAGRLSGVIDWGNALYGDPLYDIAWLLYWWAWYPAWQGIDLTESLDRHWRAHGGPPDRMQERLLCYLIHIGLDNVAYSAFKERPEQLRRNTEQLLTYLQPQAGCLPQSRTTAFGRPAAPS